jgi:hypothetical protein
MRSDEKMVSFRLSNRVWKRLLKHIKSQETAGGQPITIQRYFEELVDRELKEGK